MKAMLCKLGGHRYSTLRVYPAPPTRAPGRQVRDQSCDRCGHRVQTLVDRRQR